MVSFEDIYDDKEPETAYRLLLPHAEAGNAKAQFYVGQLCEELFPEGPMRSVEWYQRASDGGNIEATHWLASHLYFGMGIDRDIPRALALFRICAKAGLDASQWKLGQHLLAEAASTNEAIDWLRLAAAQGHTAAAELLNEHSGARMPDDAGKPNC
jgi:TPR repeat protein